MRWALIIAGIIGTMLLFPANASAGKMFLEYQGELNPRFTFYRGAFDLGDIDRDGSDEMVIADDSGGFQVYQFSTGGFTPMWINSPLIESGFIVAVDIMYENSPRIMPQILLLDSAGTLHRVRYTGYLFEEIDTIANYRPPGESGRLVVTGVGGGTHNVLIAIGSGQEDEPSSFAGMTLYRLTPSGLVQLSAEELSKLEEGDVYFVQDLTADEIAALQALGGGVPGLLPSGSPESNRAGIADLDQDAILELLVAMSDPDRPIDRLEIFKEEGGSYTVRVTLELPLMNEMHLGDIDGDGFNEIVGITFDGEVLVYQWDSLVVKLKDGSELTWETPHREVNGIIWMSLGGFEALGCETQEDARYLSITRGGHRVVLDRTAGEIKCDGEVLLPDVPPEMLESTPFLPLLPSLDCLGFFYSYSPEQNLIQLEN